MRLRLSGLEKEALPTESCGSTSRRGREERVCRERRAARSAQRLKMSKAEAIVKIKWVVNRTGEPTSFRGEFPPVRRTGTHFASRSVQTAGRRDWLCAFYRRASYSASLCLAESEESVDALIGNLKRSVFADEIDQGGIGLPPCARKLC